MTGVSYDAVRAAVSETGSDSRVEVNQRALIDKILARYASAGAVYRELLQNSNDAEASEAEVRFRVGSDDVVQEVVYRNNGLPFRPQDWDRLRKIAEGNPSPEKVGAFGVGAYTMFSIAEEPLVISGKEALAFVWKGDALWTKTAKAPPQTDGGDNDKWTTFVLPSRDPYAIPDWVEFGQFLCASLTFTQCLKTIRVYVNDKKKMEISKKELQAPRIVSPPKASSWYAQDGAVTSSSRGVFSLGRSDGSITETVQEFSVNLDTHSASVRARYVSGMATTKIGSEMARKMERVTKKKPPSKVNVQILINAEDDFSKDEDPAASIVRALTPHMGAGRVFIGFRTSQTTGLAAHLAAPLVPTVEREAVDFQDASLCIFNTELLEIAGILMRLALEHSMSLVGEKWLETEPQRTALEEKLEQDAKRKKKLVTKEEPKIVEKARQDEQEESSSGGGGSFLGFAKFMAKGVKKKISTVLSYADSLVDNDGTAELLNPGDLRPLSSEEKEAILLMRSFCPQQSTPDSRVGTAIATGFSRCIQAAPPVLTKSGIVRGSEGRLPYHGMEAFCKSNVIRKLVFQNAQEYHEVIARCRRLAISDVLQALQGRVMEQEEVVRLLKWWGRYFRIDPGISAYRLLMKESILFHPEDDGTAADSEEIVRTVALRDIQNYVHEKLFPPGLPMPSSVLSPTMQEQIGMKNIVDTSLMGWFSPLTAEIWADFISRHRCMNAGEPEDDRLRVLVLSTLSKEYNRRVSSSKVSFSSLLQSLLAKKRCIPFDSDTPTRYAAEFPSDLYIYSAELKAFEGLGSFNKVAQSLKNEGVTDEFLLALGVRKSVSIDFLFSQLDTLQWSSNPKPLMAYLRTASLTSNDLRKLRSTQYLPAQNDKSRTYAPGELYLPNDDLAVFPFIKMLQWPQGEDLTGKSADGVFLTKLGCKVYPPLQAVLSFMGTEVKDEQLREKCLNFVSGKLGPGGFYTREYSPTTTTKFLPCIQMDPFIADIPSRELCAPSGCYSEAACMVMGFPVLDPNLDKKSGHLYSGRFQCPEKPSPDVLITKLSGIVARAKGKLASAPRKERSQLNGVVIAVFDDIFRYLSTRSTDFSKRHVDTLRKDEFIPCMVDGALRWYKPGDVYFQSDDKDENALTELLFHLVPFSQFLASAGVKSEASNRDIFRLLIASPETVLKLLGSEAKYRTLLRRIAANPPFKTITHEIQQSPFLLAYRIEDAGKKDDSEQTVKYKLARASDICIIDNSFFGRMFPVLRAPHESDLEDFYARLGCEYISKKVTKNYEVFGRSKQGTPLTLQFAERIRERRPLLVSPNVTSRPLVKNAASLLDDSSLEFFQASDLKAVYTLGKSVRNQRVTCCVKPLRSRKSAIYITDDFDWFDVGYAVGGLILQRCQLEDAFFIGSILEAPLDQLRARGFPVDRILKPVKPIVEEAEAKPAARTGESVAGLGAAFGGASSSAGSSSLGPVMAAGGGRPQFDQPHNDGNPVSPQNDKSSQRNIENILENAIKSSTRVNSQGVSSPQTVLTSIPEGLDRGSGGCEILPSHSLKPFAGPYRTGKTSNGIRVFSSVKAPDSEAFLEENFHAIDNFAVIAEELCVLYSLDLDSVAIFHDSRGGTIAFNANRAIHLNVRFFYALHYNLQDSLADCYSYWFTTIAHELAHNLASGHNKEHGYYTESFVTKYLPKLAALMAEKGLTT